MLSSYVGLLLHGQAFNPGWTYETRCIIHIWIVADPVHDMTAYGGNGGIVLFSLSFDIVWTLSGQLDASAVLLLEKRTPRYPLNRMLYELPSPSVSFEQMINFSPLPEIDRYHGYPVRILVTIPTELSWLKYNLNFYSIYI
jgi:hypothetical protein